MLDIIAIFGDASRMRYPGGKGKCFQQIINRMPPHSVYVETHLGGGAVMRHKKPAVRQIGIERDPAVAAVWREQGYRNFELIEADALAWLQAAELPSDALLYVDPPYLAATRRKQRIYRFDYSVTQHEELIALLLTLKCRVMVSGYDSALYRESFNHWSLDVFPAQTHTGLRTEHLWFNFQIPSLLHDARFAGNSFREREAIKRRLLRLDRRIARLDLNEQAALCAGIEARIREQHSTLCEESHP